MRFGLSILLTVLMSAALMAQYNSFNFRKLGLQDGLHDGVIRCIGEDKFGFIWIGSVGALNRFDGRRVIHFTHDPNDSTSPYGGQPRCMFTDAKGRFWIGTESGLMEYDYTKGNFRRIPALKNIFIQGIISINDSVLFLATSRGLVRYQIGSEFVFQYGSSEIPEHAALFRNGINKLVIHGHMLYMATQQGVVMMDTRTGTITSPSITTVGKMPVASIAVDSSNNLWLGIQRNIKLVKVSPDFTMIENYDRFLTANFNTQPLNVKDILVDNHNRVWVITAVDGLLEYDANTNGFIRHLHNSNVSASPSSNYWRSIYQDKEGIIWLGGDFYGVDFFNPDKIFFKTLLPYTSRLDERARMVGRAVTEDKDGNIWMGTHDGVSRYNIRNGSYTEWRNEENGPLVLYSNGVRSICCDKENNIWIGTAAGVNRFNYQTRRMEFIDVKNLPASFYNSINLDRKGNVWFCTNDTASLYWYQPSDQTYHNISEHPKLRNFKGIAPASYLMEDSKQRLWISISRNGLGMYDQVADTTYRFMAGENGVKGLVGNQVIDIKEDRHGVIWASTFNGISGIDTDRGNILSFNNRNGLVGNMVSSLVIDDNDRIWLGVNGGLMMLDTSRKRFTTFSLSDGLPSVGFPEHAGIQTANGDIMMPTNKGFLRFTPKDYVEATDELGFYLTGYSVFNAPHTLLPDNGDTTLKLKADENSFSFDIVALNFVKPGATWFAYRLDGFEKGWHYTRDGKAVYTNVPGGNYTFQYKAALSNANWENITPKTVKVHLAAVFYESPWFWILVLGMLAAFSYYFYRFRLHKQRQILTLETKAESLEKEKAMIQYESLKQHLNPHFLFNSLTSLRSLIKTDAKTAAWFLDNMSRVYRYVLRSGDQELVPLQDEVTFVQTFAELQQVRFGEGLQVRISIGSEDAERFVAPVVLQNLVENAIKHNTTSVDSPLVIEIFTEQGKLLVRNNLQRYKSVETSNRRGLVSLHKLYSFFTDLPVTINEDDKYFTVSIPLL